MNSKAKVPGRTPVGDFDGTSSGFACNEDALMEILLWLPAKYLIQLKLVCKQWLSLISSDQFCHLHTLHHPKLQPSLILKTPPCSFCTSIQSSMKRVSTSTTQPKRSRKISLADTHSNKYLHLALAFDPSKSSHYKIVCIRSSLEPLSDSCAIRTYQIEVYDSESHTWKLTLELTTSQLAISRGVYCNGSIYWDGYAKLYCFDIAKNVLETFSRPIYPPTQNDRRAFTSYLQESNGHLYHSSLASDDKCGSVMVWELQRDDIHSLWLLKHHNTFPLPSLTFGTPNITKQLRFIKGSHDTEACSLVFQRSGKICVYSFIDKSLKELVDLASQPFCYKLFSFEGHEFGESLAVV